MQSRHFVAVGVVALWGVACAAPGRYVDVDPIYEPVQQVYQSFYRAPAFKPQGMKLAVMDFKGGLGVGQVFADTLAAELFNSGFTVVERQNLDVLLGERTLASTGAQKRTDAEVLQDVGRMAGVDVVIVGGVVAYSEDVSPLEFSQPIQLPFTIQEKEEDKRRRRRKRKGPPSGTITYRWKPGSFRTPAGIPVNPPYSQPSAKTAPPAR